MASLVVDVKSIRPVSVSFTETSLVVELADGRSIASPLEWYPRLAKANDEQRRNVVLERNGLHWPTLDEDLSILGMLAGRRTTTGKSRGLGAWKGRVVVPDSFFDPYE
jgi:hypothetical protein